MPIYFLTITVASLGRFLYFCTSETGMNTPQSHVIHLLNQVKSSLLDNLVVGRPNSTINDNASQ